MANLTYHATASVSTDRALSTTEPLQISATLADPTNTAQQVSIPFTLVSNVPSGSSLATLNAIFPSPIWSSLGTEIQNVNITYTTFGGTANTGTSAVVGPVNMTTGSATPQSNEAGSTAQSPAGSPVPGTTSGISNGTNNVNQTSTPSVIHGASTGTLAGAAVGCLIAGMLVAGLIAWFFFRRRSNSRTQRSQPEKTPLSLRAQKESLVVDAGATKAWNKRLPQSDSDKSIAHLANRTLDEIEMYVEEFYVNKPTSSLGLGVAQDLSPFESMYLPGPLAELLRTTSTPTVLIKHCIAFFLLQKVDPSNNIGQCLLPREFVTPQTLQVSQQDSRQAVSQIRVLMAQTRPDPGQDEQYLAQRDKVITNAVGQVEQAFRPWARGDESKRASALKGVAIHMSELGIKLFTQPASFDWRWEQPSTLATSRATSRKTTDGLAMLPGLDKITDHGAKLLPSPICLAKPRTANQIM